MIRLLRPSATQLRIGGLTFAALVLGFSGLYSLFYSLSSPERLKTIAADTVAGTGRSITFDEAHISRTLFPRPTVTVRNIAVSRPDGAQTDLRIDEMKLGLAWKSLLGQEEIEKWVFIRPDIRLEANENGRFALADLLSADSERPPVNRLYLDNARVTVQTAQYAYSLPVLNLRLKGLASGRATLEADGSFQTGGSTQAEWQTRARLDKQAAEWQFSDVQAQAGGQWHKRPFNLTADGRLVWQTDTAAFHIKPLNAKLSLPEYRAHLNAVIPSAHIRDGALSLPELNAVMTSDYQQARWDGTLSLTRLHLRPTVASIDKLAFSGSRKDGTTDMYATLAGPLNWQQNQGWESGALLFGSRVENTLGERNIRFHSELSGHFSYAPDGAWQGRLNGLFDRQSAAFEAAYTPAKETQTALLSGKAELGLLSVNPYLAVLSESKGRLPLIDWLKQGRLKIDAALSVKSLQWNSVETDGLSTRILADRQAVRLPDFRAALYGGQTEGSIEIGLSEPLSYRIHQTAEQVQIRPLLQDLLHHNRISGQGRAVLDLSSKGNSRSEWIQNLGGTMQLNLHDGALWGVDLNDVFNQTPPAQGEARHTPFKRFLLSSTLQNGISSHREARLFSDTLDFVSDGTVDFNTLTMNEKTKLFPHNGKGSPVPIDIRGPLDNPSVTVDYDSLTAGLASPEAKRQAITETLKEQWRWLKPKTPSAEAASAPR